MRLALDWDAFLGKTQDSYRFKFDGGRPAIVTRGDRAEISPTCPECAIEFKGTAPAFRRGKHQQRRCS